MRLRHALGALGIAAIATTTHAAAPRKTTRILADELTAMPAAGVAKQLRVQRDVRFGARATPAWQRFSARAGGSWRASWDVATGVPSRIWGSGIAVPGANASPAIAEAAARSVLSEHLALLAPGSTTGDFVLVSNHSDGEIRSVGFVQRAHGRRVVGGQLSFRFKRDRLFVIGSEALPHVRVDQPRARLARGALHARASVALRSELDLAGAFVGAPGDEVIVPLVADGGVLGYRIATPLVIDGGADGRYLAYVDPQTAGILAVHQQNQYATGTVVYRSVDRHPLRGRRDVPASRARVTVGGAMQTTTITGTVTWTPDVPQMVTTSIVGDLVTVIDKGGTGTASAQLAIPVGGQVTWDASASSEQDAQVVVFVATNTAKQYVAANVDPMMRGLGDSIDANVNIEQSCNAFYNGALNFLHASTQCQNTGLIEDVVYHEFGHALHAAEIIEGVGLHDGAMSEGASDFLAASITGDPEIARGFLYDDEPLRELDPLGEEFVWPRDITEIHQTGRIYGGTFWDLRKALIASNGQAAGVALVNKLYVATLRRAVSIPSSLVEALAADDDDGNLANGTPNECAIRDAFGRHGMRSASGTLDQPGAVPPGARETTIRAELGGLSACPSDAVDRITLVWVPSNSPVPAGTAAMSGGPTTFSALLPLPEQGTMFYSAKVQFTDGTVLTVPDNLGNPTYELYQGDTVALYCTTFETDPFADGWTTGTSDAEVASPWAWGLPAGGATDPPTAFSGFNVLEQTGSYPARVKTWVALPPIDVGQWSDVRLQYRRWLAVEDSQFDQAQIEVNGERAWVNFTAKRGDSSMLHHVDREWRFDDLGVSGYGFGHQLDIAFTLTADPGLALGGWALDDVCVVANLHSVCGDGVKTPTEGCDDGDANADAPDRCRTYCKVPTCGDGILDDPEECDEGAAGTARCSATCIDLSPPVDTGCCSGSAGGALPLVLAGLGGIGLLRRRRRRAGWIGGSPRRPRASS